VSLSLWGGDLRFAPYPAMFTAVSTRMSRHELLDLSRKIAIMPAPTRPATAGQRKPSTMRPPLARPGASRAQTATPTLTAGRTSPADSMASSKARTPKRKAPAEIESEACEETNINVVVRCRGRSDREVKENSGVVVSTDGIKGKKVELSMGPSALSNKTYAFDKVFSPAADQGIIFDEVVSPILDEVWGANHYLAPRLLIIYRS
jgi:kinesin family member 11